MTPATLADLASFVVVSTGWAPFRDKLLQVTQHLPDPVLWDMVQLTAAAFQLDKQVSFLALPNSTRGEMLCWLRTLGTGWDCAGDEVAPREPGY